jgi:periplasmic protein TonB
MKKIIVFCFALAIFSCLNAQTTQSGNNPSSSDDKVFTIVQQKPVFPGDINKWLAGNIIYPQDARMQNVQGTVYVSFIIEKNGSVSTAQVMRGVNKSLNDESLQVISKMPKWNPGMQNGHTVRVQYMVPIRYTLNDNNTTTPAQSKQ